MDSAERQRQRVLIGLVGTAGSGKTEIARHLQREMGFQRVAFADPLKKILIKAGMCTYDECYVEKTDLSRWLLQKIGTDIFRKQVNEYYWVNAMSQILYPMIARGEDDIVIDDIRFEEEAMLVRQLNGRLVRVVRTGYTDQTAGNHESETNVAGIVCDDELVAASGEIQKLFDGIEKVVAGMFKSDGLS